MGCGASKAARAEAAQERIATLTERIAENDPMLTAVAVGELRADTTAKSVGDALAKALGKALATNTSLTSLSLASPSEILQGTFSGSNALHCTCAATARSLISCSVRRGSWTGNTFTDKGAKALADAVWANKALRSLDVNGDERVELHLDIKRVWRRRRRGKGKAANDPVVNLAGRGFTDMHARTLAKELKRNKAVEQVVLSDNALTDAGAGTLRAAFLNTFVKTPEHPLKSVVLDGNPRMSKVAGTLLRVAVNDMTLLDVDLSKCKLEDAVLGELATALARNATALSIDLSRNKLLTDAGLRLLLPALSANKSLQSVRVDGLKDVCETMRIAVRVALNDPEITKIKLVDAEVTNDGARDLALALAKNKLVRVVDLRDNPAITDEGKHALWDRFRASKYFVKLELDGWSSKSDSADFSDFATILRRVQQNDPALSKVVLVSQELQDREHVKPLAKALATNTTVTDVDLELNSIGDKGVRMLVRMLGYNNTITRLHLGHQYGYNLQHATKEKAEALARDPKRNTGAKKAQGPAAVGSPVGGRSTLRIDSLVSVKLASRRRLLQRAMSSQSLALGAEAGASAGSGSAVAAPSPTSKIAMLGRSPSLASLNSRLSTSSRLSRRRQTLVMDAPFSKRVMDKLAAEGVITIKKGKGKGSSVKGKGKRSKKKGVKRKRRKKRKSKSKSKSKKEETSKRDVDEASEWNPVQADGSVTKKKKREKKTTKNKKKKKKKRNRRSTASTIEGPVPGIDQIINNNKDGGDKDEGDDDDDDDDDDDAHTLPLGERLEGRRQKLEDWRGASLEDRTAIAKDVYDFDALSSSSEEPDVGDLTDGEDYYEEMHTRLLPDESEY